MTEIAVLVVDDHASLRRNVLAMLEDEGFVVAGAESGEEGLVCLSSFAANVALVDMRLPGIDGNEFIQRAHRLHPALSFIVLTGSVDYVLPDEIAALGLSSASVFMKPLADPDALFRRLRSLVESAS